MRDYELMVVLSPDLDEAGQEAASQRLKSMLQARGAELASLEGWGKRRLAYPIGRFRDGQYTIAHFKMAPNQADELDRALKLSEQVIRHLLIRLDSR
ncbi:MAG: 30S ribosomal protein S6 [Chloroflexi bacterium]|nr:30S ribosomal protein S6 [Chloroflexota bacterium]